MGPQITLEKDGALVAVRYFHQPQSAHTVLCECLEGVFAAGKFIAVAKRVFLSSQALLRVKLLKWTDRSAEPERRFCWEVGAVLMSSSSSLFSPLCPLSFDLKPRTRLTFLAP